MTQEDYKISRELKERLAEFVPLVDFKVFGSRARGTAGEYSDMDVFIEVDEIDRQLKQKIRSVIWEVGFKYFLYISPHIFTRWEIEDSPLRASPIVKNIEEEGIRV